jgi:Transposase, Mutator family.
VVNWSFAYAENQHTWTELFNQIKDSPFALVCDGQRGQLKAARERWSNIVIQRCQFHVIHQANLLLTKNPESIPAQELKRLVSKITKVKTRDDLNIWLIKFKTWYVLYEDFLNEKTYSDSLTPTGRHKWHYTHAKLHRSFSHISNALPNLFQYIKYPQIPNTSNRIEGSVNAHLQRTIDFHRGSNLIGQRQLIAAFLKGKQGEKPPRNFV